MILAFSWQAFIQAFVDPSLIYLPLRSFFLPIKVTFDSNFYNLPGWVLASEQIKPFISFKILNEVLIWCMVIVFICVFLKIMELKLWFLHKEEPIVKKSFKDILKNIPSMIKGFFESAKRQRNDIKKPNFVPVFMPKNIFDLDYSQITFLSLIVSFLAIFLFPGDSSDLFGYVARGAQQALYDQNPFSELVMSIPNWQAKPFLANFLWSQNPSPYGPFFMLICKAMVNLSFGNFWLALFFFKLSNWLIFFLLISLIYSILNDEEFSKHFFLNQYTHEQELKIKKIAYALIALNPFLIIECIWNAHNDLYMAFFIVFSLYMLLKKNFNLALVGICCATLIKYFSIVLLPFAIIYYLKTALSDSIKSNRTVLSYLANFPFVGVLTSLSLSYYVINLYDLSQARFKQISQNMTLSHKSLFDLINSLYKYISHQDLPSFFKQFFIAAFAVFFVYMVIKYWRSFKELDVFEYSFWVFFVLIFVASPKFHSWYLCALLPLMVLVKPRLALILSLTHLLSLTFIDQANTLNYLVMTAMPVTLYFRFLHHQDRLKI